MMRGLPSVVAALAAIGEIGLVFAAQTTEPPRRREEPMRASAGSDAFNGGSLDNKWSFNDPNGNDLINLNARPGWLRIQVRGPDEDMWTVHDMKNAE